MEDILCAVLCQLIYLCKAVKFSNRIALNGTDIDNEKEENCMRGRERANGEERQRAQNGNKKRGKKASRPIFFRSKSNTIKGRSIFLRGGGDGMYTEMARLKALS